MMVVSWFLNVLWLGLKLASGMIHLVVLVGLAMVVWGLVRRGAGAVKSRL